MSAPKAVSNDGKDEFWMVVRGCLREFHGMKAETSRRKAAKLRGSIEHMTAAQVEFFYHSEPFDVACEIAGEPLAVEEYLDRYLHLRDEKHGNGVSSQKSHQRQT